MRKGIIIAGFAILSLGGCAQVQSTLTSPDAMGCALALVASGQRDVAGLTAAANRTPACMSLEAALIQAAIREAMLRVRQP